MKQEQIDNFINGVCIECGIIDSRVVKSVYNGLVRYITNEINRTKLIELPMLGTFKKSSNNKANIIRYNLQKGTKENCLSTTRLNFKINPKLRMLTKEFLD
jgi:nucleoid DNA-binding protein